jgi:hypothetical protein
MRFEEEIRNHQREQTEHIEKSIDFSLDKIVYDEIEKARSGIYADTYENRKKGIVGQKYGYTKSIGSKEENRQKSPNTKESNDRYKTEEEVEKRLDEVFNTLRDEYNFDDSRTGHLTKFHNKNWVTVSRSSDFLNEKSRKLVKEYYDLMSGDGDYFSEENLIKYIEKEEGRGERENSKLKEFLNKD